MGYCGVDIVNILSFFLCLMILAIGCWAYAKTKDIAPFHISAAFGLFAVSHFISFMGLARFHALAIMLIKVFAYLIVALSLYQIAAQKK